MIKKVLKKYLALIIISAGAFVTGVSYACADGDDWADFFNSFFAPEVSNSDEFKPFFRSQNSFYGNYQFSDAIHETDSVNLEEWYNFFSGKVSIEDLKYVIYKSRIGEIDTLIFYLKNSHFPINEQLKKNSIISFNNQTTSKEFLFYQGYAKRCEPFSTYEPDWWGDDKTGDPRNDTVTIRRLITGGQKALLSAKHPFIKQRYLFQIIRLLYQAGFYRESIAFFNENSVLFSPKQLIYYRSIGYIAASYYKLKNYSQANYLYAVIYDNCDAMRKSSYLSFHPQDESDWEGSLILAKNNREKEVLWFLLGIYADPTRAMRAIYKINPKSDLLDVLLVRAVNINEEWFLSENNYWGQTDSSYALLPHKVNFRLFEFVSEVADLNMTRNPYLWYLASGYLNLVKGNYSKAESFLAKSAALSTDNQLVSEQIRCFRIISSIEQYTSINLQFENVITKELRWLDQEKHHPALRKTSIYQWSLSRLSEKYYNWGDSVKAQLLDDRQHFHFYSNEQNVNHLISFMDKPNKTDFEKYILHLYPHSRSSLFTFKAIKCIYQYKFEEALAKLDSCKNAGCVDLPANPFRIRIKDCHDCDYNVSNDITYTTYTLVKELIDLQKKMETDTKNTATYSFLLANALYNITYFGNSHDVFDSPFIGINVGYLHWDWDEQMIASHYSLFDCSKAMEFYQKAMDASTDNEFKAKCCFMASKCEQNQYFVSPTFSFHQMIKSGNYYKILYDRFRGTEYYQEVLNECGYFRTYANQKK